MARRFVSLSHFLMAVVALVHSGETFRVPRERLASQCDLFNDPALLAAPYAVRSSVPLAAFRAFVAALNKETFELTNDNVGGLSLLCAEFGFRAFSARLSEFRASPAFHAVLASEDAEARLRTAVLEERWLQGGHEFTKLRSRISRLEAEVMPLRPLPKVPAEVSAPKTAPIPPSPPPRPAPVRFDSLIVSDFPEIFAEFRGKRFLLLWRGSRDGFGPRHFHSRRDRQANTLTVILDTNGNVFGGFTPVKWESRKWNENFGRENNCWKADDSLRSFLFTLKNPHNIPARRFALITERRDEAIRCFSEYGPHFRDIAICDNCNASTGNYTFLGRVYINDTRLDGGTVFTNAPCFQVREVEVFEIIE
jgi:hypothetical protein